MVMDGSIFGRVMVKIWLGLGCLNWGSAIGIRVEVP